MSPTAAPSPFQKPQFPRAVALEVAGVLWRALKPVCERIIFAGSLRRLRPMVGDVECLYISRTEVRPRDLFDRVTVSLADDAIAALEKSGVVDRRLSVLGSQTYGPKNKLLLHVETGLPIDLFAATHENWFNYLVCRTGPTASNVRIAAAAKARGWQWNPYGPGFSRAGELVKMDSEKAVFEFVNLPFFEPPFRR